MDLLPHEVLTGLPLPPPRRWFRFSLRTMFVGVTVLAVWLGWHASIVHQRKLMRSKLESRGFQFEVLYDAERQCDPWHNGGYEPCVSLTRSLLGDFAIASIHMSNRRCPSREDCVLAAAWFPETAFICGCPNDVFTPDPLVFWDFPCPEPPD
jgi:hypothetical protein